MGLLRAPASALELGGLRAGSYAESRWSPCFGRSSERVPVRGVLKSAPVRLASSNLARAAAAAGSAAAIVDVDCARVAGRLAVSFGEREIELLECRVPEGLLARRDREGRIALGLDHALEIVDRVRRRPVANDLDVALAAHVDVRVLLPHATAAVADGLTAAVRGFLHRRVPVTSLVGDA